MVVEVLFYAFYLWKRKQLTSREYRWLPRPSEKTRFDGLKEWLHSIDRIADVQKQME